MTRTLRLTVVLLMLSLAGSVRAQPMGAGTGFISGQVVEGGTTKPVPGATVTLFTTTRAAARTVIADGQGRYVFPSLPSGEFRLQASRPGWRAGAYGLDEPIDRFEAGEILRLAVGERARATVPVWRNAALITGRVTDQSGEPLAGARVEAVRWTAIHGRRSLTGGNLSITDDRGLFAMWVQPGEFMIAATSDQVRMREARPYGYRRTFFPRAQDTSGAAVFAVRSGDERNGLDIQLSLEPVFRITGVLNQVDAGRMPPRLELRSEWETTPRYLARPIDAQGRFTIDNIPPGRYMLQTPAGSLGSQEPSDGELWARVPLEITNRDLDVRVDLRRRLLVSGRVRFDGSATVPTPQDGISIGVRLFREEDLPLTDVVPSYTSAGADGRFTLAVPPGRYVVSSGASIRSIQDLRNGPGPAAASARAWSLRSGTYGGRDVADIPLVVTSDVSGLELTFTDRQPLVRGRVTSRQGRVESAQLLAFPLDESIWSEFTTGRRLRAMRLPADGSFELRNLPEGDYFLTAVRGLPQDYESWRMPAFLEALARSARRVSLIEGQTTIQDVELVAAPAFNAARALPPVVVEPSDRAIVRELAADAPRPGATISGTVVAAGSNAPIAGARVGLTQGVVGVQNNGGAYTDSEGRFTLAEIPGGQHTLYVSRPPYVNTAYGAATPADPGTPVSVTNGQRLSGLTIAMIKGAAIGGTVTDQNGQPLSGVQVGVRAYRWTARGREPVDQRGLATFNAGTNQRGEYRTFGLAPGDYIIQATVQGATSAMPLTTQADVDAAARPAAAGAAAAARVDVMYTPMFYPNTANPLAAQAVKLGPGDDQVIDFQFRLTPTATVSGVVRTPDGSAPNRLGLNLTQNDSLAAPRSHFGSTESNGAFTIRGIPPGSYVLTTSGASTQSIAPARTFTGAVQLFVDRDLTGVVLDLVPMATVIGRVHGEVTAALRQPAVRISLSPLPGTVVPPNLARSAPIAADNSFSIPNVPPGRYRFELTGPNTIVKPRVASQRVRDIETADAGLEVKGGETVDVDVELVTSEATVGGRLRDRSGQPATGPYVVLFARNPGGWTPPSRRIFGVRPDQNGRYIFADVPAGDYLVTTLAGVEAGDWFDPAMLAKLAAVASPVTVRRGDALEIDLETR